MPMFNACSSAPVNTGSFALLSKSAMSTDTGACVAGATDVGGGALWKYHQPPRPIPSPSTIATLTGSSCARTFDLAGTGRADPSSLAAALRLAAELVANESAG